MIHYRVIIQYNIFFYQIYEINNKFSDSLNLIDLILKLDIVEANKFYGYGLNTCRIIIIIIWARSFYKTK